MSNVSSTLSYPANIASMDGRGGEEAPSDIGPRYLYYRLYQGSSAIESRSPAYSNDRFIGRILSRAVTPPHTVTSLKSHICKIEGFSRSRESSLYSSLPRQTALKGHSHLALVSPSGPGSSEKTPIVLVIENPEKWSPGTPGPLAGLPPAGNTHYVHYRIYNKDGEMISKTSFDEDDLALGRINIVLVGLPSNVATLKERLARVEGVEDKQLQLFLDLSSDEPMNDNVHIPLRTDLYPGFRADEPMAFVCLDLPALESPKPKRKKRVEIVAKESFQAPSDTTASLSIHQGKKLLSKGS